MVATHTPALLVPAKLTPPQPLATWVLRERLLARLAASDARLTLVVAPAGFGKSTLVAQWLLGAQPELTGAYVELAVGALMPPPPPELAVAWLSLDEHDQDELRFLAYMAGAIEQVRPGILPTTRALLATPDPPPHVVLQALLVELSAPSTPLTLVIDDYHVVEAEAIHKAVAYLLRHMPPHCRLVLLSRVDPPLPLARLRADQQVVDLRAADLRFTEAEAGDLLARMCGDTLDTARVAALHQQTEGWAIALQLAALARPREGLPDHTPDPAKRQIAEYLADEVFDRQPRKIQQALMALAVPERFCAGLCAALLGTPGELTRAESVLEQLVRANLFLIALDQEGQWYRFHQIFRDLLLRRLRLTAGEDGVRDLQLRAADWLAAEGLAEEALRHYLAAGEEDVAADLVERHMFMNLGRELGTVPPGYWLRMLPDGLVTRRLGLALIAARLASFNTDVPALEASLARVDALLDTPITIEQPLPWPTFPGDHATLRGSLRYWQGRPAEAIRDLQTALELGPVPTLASQALHILGKAFVADGRYDEGVQSIQHGLAGTSGVLGVLDRATRCLSLCGMHATAGTVDDLACAAQGLADEVNTHKLGDFWICYAAAYRGRAAYERSDLGAAAHYFADVVRRKYQINAPNYIGCLAGLAQIAIIQGDLDVAAAYVREVQAFASELHGAFLQHQALACAVRLALARGDLRAALDTAHGIGPDIHQGINTWFGVEPPRLSQARVLILSADAANLAHAETILTSYLAEVEPLHNTRLLITTLAIQALLRQAQGRPAEALAALQGAVELAAPRGYMRTFADVGPTLVPLLETLAARGVATAYLVDVLALVGPSRQPQEQPAPPARQTDPPELLTRRELEILALLAERWSDKEIAVRLIIAPNTVRKHTSTIYGKLGVSSRREAVEAARARGLLQ